MTRDVFLSAAALFLVAAVARAEDAPTEIVLREALRIDRAGTSSRSLVHTDAVEASIVAGEWKPPRSGTELELPDGSMRRWTAVKAGDDGAFTGAAVENGSYLSFRVPSDDERVMLLHAVGHDFVYVNGELRPGDPYGYGWLRLPVLLKKGANELLFRVSRGRLEARLVVPPAETFLSADDATLPDVEAGPPGIPPLQDPDVPAGVVVVNASRAWASGLQVIEESGRARARQLAPIPPLSLAKAAVVFPRTDLRSKEAPADTRLALMRVGTPGPGFTLAFPRVAGRYRSAIQRVFTSRVDGSVQPYVVVQSGGPSAVLLTLHGASVTARGHAEAYGSHPWLRIVAPTNRRPYGFDWEDWGRIDALEALDQEREERATWPDRTYVTGHSMGGHGAWHLAVTYPDRFAAVGPSAGWVSFRSYGGAPAASDEPVASMLDRATSTSDTLALLGNLRDVGVYALHGDADDNVPVTEMRTVVERLKSFHPDFRFHEQRGAGHWWDAPDGTPGVACVAWPPMLEFFAKRVRPPAGSLDEIEFSTMHPGVSSKCRGVTIVAQERAGLRSSVKARFDAQTNRIVATTENVAEVVFDAQVGHDFPRSSVSIDGKDFTARRDTYHWALARRDGTWTLASSLQASRKTPVRCGPFKAAFDHRFVLVVATKGTPEENAWAAAKARLDAETWYYRANGSPDVVPDVEYVAKVGEYAARNAILYGHAEMNAAWATLLAKSPVQIRRGVVRVGERETKGENLACLFVRPMEGSENLSVGVIAGTGMPGLRLTDRLPYFSSGVGVPDVVVLSTDMLSKGLPGVVGAGFFGGDWSVEKGELAWR